MYAKVFASKYRAMGTAFGSFVFVFFTFFSSVSLVSADSSVFNGYQLPHALPWNDGTDTWNFVRAVMTSATGCTGFDKTTGCGTWTFYYHNEPNLYVSCNPNSGTCSTSSNVIRNSNDGTGSYSSFKGTYTCRSVTIGNGYVKDSPNHYTDNAKNDYTTSSGCSNAGTSSNSAQYNHFSVGRGIYAISPSTTAYWDTGENNDDTNTVFVSGDLVIPRVNIGTDGITVISSPSPAPSVIVTSTGIADYVSLPSPLTDPTGFIAGVFTNFFIFVYKGFIPPDGYLTDKLAEVTTAWGTDQPGLAGINTAFANGVTSLGSPSAMTPISIGSLTVAGATTSSITVFDPSTLPSGIFDTAKALMSAFMYFGVAFWVIREMSVIFSA